MTHADSKKYQRTRLLRHYEMLYFAEIFLVSAIFALVFIRVFLALTGYPQLGGDGLHIAHMLWGGLGMAIALGVSIFFLERSARLAASVIGGIGFGAFIDELGKFITSDNNYFFQPTLAIIYVIFIIVFFVVKILTKAIKPSSHENALNSFELLKEVYLNKFDEKEKKKFIYFINQADLHPSLKKGLITTANLIHTIPDNSLSSRLANYWRNTSLRIIKSKLFKKFLALIFTLSVINTFLRTFTTARIAIMSNEPSIMLSGLVISSIVAGVLATIGLIKLFSTYINALHWFRWSLLVNILLQNFFFFYFNQLQALIGLSFNIALFYLINMALSKEKTDHISA